MTLAQGGAEAKIFYRKARGGSASGVELSFEKFDETRDGFDHLVAGGFVDFE